MVVEYTFNIAEEALHNVVIGALIYRRSQLFKKVALSFRKGLELMPRELRLERLSMMIVVVS
jgi:hypothetical protein